MLEPEHRWQRILARAVAGLGVFALLMTAEPSVTCGQQPARAAGDGSLICGVIDMSRVPARLDWVDLLRIDVEPAQIITLPARDGLFARFDIQPGTYRFLRFGGAADDGSGDLVYLFPPEGVSWAEFDPARPDPMPPDSGQRLLFVREPGVYCLGSRSITILQPFQYRVVPVARPTETEILRRLLDRVTLPDRRALVSRRLTAIGGDPP